MTYKEAERALVAGAPVELGNGRDRIICKEISGLVYRKDSQSGRYPIRLELADKCGHSVTITRLEQVRLAPGWKGELPKELPPPYEDGPSVMELNAKTALRSGCAVIFEGERWKVTALRVCNWVKLDYWLFVELSRISDGLVEMAWAGSISLEDSTK